jgi:hypothetical protein
MSEIMLHGVLNMPAELWDSSNPFDSMQRQSRYFEASKLIYQQADRIAELETESEWIGLNDRLPDKFDDEECYYTFSYGVVREDRWFSAFPMNDDGYGNKCEGGCFYGPNSDSDYGGQFKDNGVTHYMKKPSLPNPPKALKEQE